MKYNIFYLLICVALLFSCTTEEYVDTPRIDATEETAQTEVVFNLSIPAQELPTTRAISDDSHINSYKVWIFKGKGENAVFDKEVEDKNVSLKRTPAGTEQLFILLPESEEEITLSMIANVPNVTAPGVGTLKSEALNALNYSIESAKTNGMPMYGEQVLIVAQGIRPDISLRRAMAKIQVDASSVFDTQFKLESVELLNINKSGKVVSGIITATENTDLIQNADSDGNCSFYIPEISDVNGDRKVSVLIKGMHKDHTVSSYYRLEFINREGVPVENIERNYKYVFLITNVSSTSGHTDRADAINSTASNVSGTGMVLQVIDNEGIMDITTDGSFFLGVTASSITAQYNTYYYFANINVQGNNPTGWNMITSELTGVSTSMDKFDPIVAGVDPKIINSVWIYIEKDSATTGQKVNVYIYSGGIRKKIEITIPQLKKDSL